MTKFSKRIVFFLGMFALIQLSACGKKGTPLPPEGCDTGSVVEFVECDVNSFPDMMVGTTKKACPPEKFPAIYPPE